MRYLAFIFFLLISVPAWAAPTPDAAQPASDTSVSSLDWNITVGAGCTNRLMTVKVYWKDSTVSTINSLTVGGNAATLIDSQTSPGGFKTTSIYRYTAPATGVVAIHIGFDVATDFVNGMAESWCGVDQTTPVGTAAKASGSSSPATVNVTSASGELVTDAVISEIGSTLTVGADQTQTYNAADVSAASYNAGASYENGGATVTMSWTQSTGDYWGIVGVPLKPVAAVSRRPIPPIVFQ